MARLLGQTTYPIQRRTTGSHVAGEWIDGPDVVPAPTLLASIQDTSGGTTREELPEGYRTRAVALVLTRDTLQILNLATQTRGDIVTYKGAPWEVIQAADWTQHRRATRHRAYIIARLGVDEQ